ncbi:hypothetical protein Hsar01_01215 [Haloferula sargassicola]|uniref:Uncharacterized protein n=1 Tax=Haloferula sargassicola TaxID=490096 RepID=A0ABP9UKE8_9BACT
MLPFADPDRLVNHHAVEPSPQAINFSVFGSSAGQNGETLLNRFLRIHAVSTDPHGRGDSEPVVTEHK